MLHDDSFITGLLIGDKKGYERGFEEGGGGSAGARDTIEFGDGMTVDIWKVPTCEKSPVGAAPSLGIEGSTEDTYYNRCVWATRRATYCLAILEEMYGFKMGTSALEPGTYDPSEDTSDRTVSLWITLDEWSTVGMSDKCVWCEAAFDGNMNYVVHWDDPMWLVVSPTAILCISKLYGYTIPIVIWGFVYAQGTDGGEWRSWTGPGLSSTTAWGYNGTAGDLSNPDTTVDDRVGADLVKRNLSSGPLAQVDNFWLIRNTNGLVRDEGGVKVVPNFASVGTSTKHASGRRLIYIAHNTSSVVNYGDIYNMYYILLPRGVSQANWRGLLARDIYEGNRHDSGFADYFIYDIENETTPNSYYSGYNKGYEDGLAAGGGGGENPGEGYDKGYQKGYQDGYAAGVAASGGDDGYTLHPAVDGATELYITIAAASLRAMQLCICQTVTRGVQIDWGDGTVETLTGTGVVYPEHNYTANGEYVIRLLPSDECTMTLGGGTSVARTVTNDTTSVVANRGCVLRKAVIGKNVVTVGRYAFEYAFGLVEVYISDGVESLGQNCFMGCSGLRRIRLPSTLTSIDAGAEFSGCQGLSEIDIPESVAAIGVNAFNGCYSLQKIEFPGITSISNAALVGCRGLQQVDFPASLQTLAYNFAGSTINLRELHIKATTPPSLNGTLATGYSNFVVYIPAGTLEAYSSANRWSSIAAKLIEE